jgi:hypothetical protein
MPIVSSSAEKLILKVAERIQGRKILQLNPLLPAYQLISLPAMSQ